MNELMKKVFHVVGWSVGHRRMLYNNNNDDDGAVVVARHYRLCRTHACVRACMHALTYCSKVEAELSLIIIIIINYN